MNPNLTPAEERALTEEAVHRLLGPSNEAVKEIFDRLGVEPEKVNADRPLRRELSSHP